MKYEFKIFKKSDEIKIARTEGRRGNRRLGVGAGCSPPDWRRGTEPSRQNQAEQGNMEMWFCAQGSLYLRALSQPNRV